MIAICRVKHSRSYESERASRRELRERGPVNRRKTDIRVYERQKLVIRCPRTEIATSAEAAIERIDDHLSAVLSRNGYGSIS
jgi:hypothetical protein